MTLDTIPLPHWACNEGAVRLLEALIAERPDYWLLTRHAWTNCRQPRFKGATARALREMWEAARHEVMGKDRDAWLALGRDHPDDLIEAVLRETEQLVEVEHLEPRDGKQRIAA